MIKISYNNNFQELFQVEVPPSKSILNRALIINYLTNSKQIIDFDNNIPTDVKLMIKALSKIKTNCNSNKIVEIDVKDAGSTMRFLTSLLSITPGLWLLKGDERILLRPIEPLVKSLKELGANIQYTEKNNFLPLLITGKKLNGGNINIDASISSQFISSLMLIANWINGGLIINLTGNPVSKPYIKLTADILKNYNIETTLSEKQIIIKNSKVTNSNYKIEADWSAATFWFALVALQPNIKLVLKGLNQFSAQADSIAIEVFSKFGVISLWNNDLLFLENNGKCASSFSFNFANCPDLAPAVAITCAGTNTKSSLYGVENLMYKECDRIAAICKNLNNIGYSSHYDTITKSIEINNQQCFVTSTKKIIKTFNDHRIAMAFALLSSKHKSLLIDNKEVVNKSYPNFWHDLHIVGFNCEEI